MFTDPILQKLSKKYPRPTWTDRSDFLFEDLVDTIISQQLSGKAATSIFNRFNALFLTTRTNRQYVCEPRTARRGNPVNEQIKDHIKNKQETFPTPEEVLLVEQGTLRSIGISNAKVQYIKNVAQAFVNKDIEIEKIKNMSDEAVIETLTKIKGIGKWSAEMILIFTLNRPDVFSLGDLGLKNAIIKLYAISDKKALLELITSWSPNRSLASWYLWRSLENR